MANVRHRRLSKHSRHFRIFLEGIKIFSVYEGGSGDLLRVDSIALSKRNEAPKTATSLLGNGLGVPRMHFRPSKSKNKKINKIISTGKHLITAMVLLKIKWKQYFQTYKVLNFFISILESVKILISYEIDRI